MNECIMCDHPILAHMQFCSIKCDEEHELLYEEMAELAREEELGD